MDRRNGHLAINPFRISETEPDTKGHKTAAQQDGGAAGRQAEIDDESAQRDKAEQRPAAIDVLDGEIASGIEHDLVDSAKRCAPADTRARAVSITART